MTRLRISSAIFTALLCGLVLAGPVWAHHSVQAQFDIHKTVSISGTVAKMEWINPHSYLTVNVKDADGKEQKSSFELGEAAALRRSGMSRAERADFKPRDHVTETPLAAEDGPSGRHL